ncbi:MAG: ABC transporter substrate-binding protein [Bacteroidales bacterium]|nr:ABC transporter substrate-binding protein [Bacteroidales bacterium]
MKKIILILFSVVYMMSSCNVASKGKSYSNDVNDTLNLVTYAKNFKIHLIERGYKLTIKDGFGSDKEYYLFNDTVTVPDEFLDEQIIKTPVKSVVAFSSTQWSVFQKLHEIEKVKGILESNYTANEEILRLVSEGKISDVGMSTNVNAEKLINLQPDLILYTPYSGIDFSYLGELSGATMLSFPDYLESHPLGRAEWMKVVGYLCGKEDVANQWFDDIARRYETLSERCSSVEEKPTVFSDLPFENQWYVPGGNSYIAKIFADAGGDYIWSDNESTGSLHIDAESVLLKAQNADFWRVINSYDTPFTYQRLNDENELYPLFKAFKEKQLLVCDVRECGYFEKSQYEPDVLLADFIYHFHPELLTEEWENYSPKYFKRLIK